MTSYREETAHEVTIRPSGAVEICCMVTTLRRAGEVETVVGTERWRGTAEAGDGETLDAMVGAGRLPADHAAALKAHPLFVRPPSPSLARKDAPA